MRIYLNQNLLVLENTMSLKNFLQQQKCVGDHFAVAVNKSFVPRVGYETIMLNENDHVDVVLPMQGG